MEEWRIIEGWERYEVSNMGSIRNAESKCILKARANNGGYMRVGLCDKGKQKWMFVHRLVAKAFIPNEDDKAQVNHIDGNKENNNVKNLEWVTSSENQQHRRSVLNKDGSPKKRVICVETGIVYESIHEAGRMTGINYRQIHAVCAGRFRTTKKLHWKYAD